MGNRNNPKFARLVTEADEGTEAEQVRRMRAAAKMLSDDAAADWLFLLPNLVVTRSSIQGVAENATTLDRRPGHHQVGQQEQPEVSAPRHRSG